MISTLVKKMNSKRDLAEYIINLLNQNIGLYENAHWANVKCRDLYDKSNINYKNSALLSMFYNATDISNLERNFNYDNKNCVNNVFPTNVMNAWCDKLFSYIGLPEQRFLKFIKDGLGGDKDIFADDAFNQSKFTKTTIEDMVYNELNHNDYYTSVYSLIKDIFFGEGLIIKKGNGKDAIYRTALVGSYVILKDTLDDIDIIIFPVPMEPSIDYNSGYKSKVDVYINMNRKKKYKYFDFTVQSIKDENYDKNKNEYDRRKLKSINELEDKPPETLKEQSCYFVRYGNQNTLSPSESPASNAYEDVRDASEGIDLSKETDKRRATPIYVLSDNSQIQSFVDKKMMKECVLEYPEIFKNPSTGAEPQAPNADPDDDNATGSVSISSSIRRGIRKGIYKEEGRKKEEHGSCGMMFCNQEALESLRMLDIPPSVTYHSSMFGLTINSISNVLGINNPYSQSASATETLQDIRDKAGKFGLVITLIRNKIIKPMVVNVLSYLIKEKDIDYIRKVVDNAIFQTDYDKILHDNQNSPEGMIIQAANALGLSPKQALDANEILRNVCKKEGLDVDLVNEKNINEITNIEKQTMEAQFSAQMQQVQNQQEEQGEQEEQE